MYVCDVDFSNSKYVLPLPLSIHLQATSIVVPSSDAVVILTVSVNTEVVLGESTILKCQYTGVTDASLLVVKWEYRPRGLTSGFPIWTFEGDIKKDSWHEDDTKFEKIDTDLTKLHAISLKRAQFEDEGTYFCNLEYYGDEYSEERGSVNIAVIGRYIIMY